MTATTSPTTKQTLVPDSYTGLDTLPKQIVSKLSKRGFVFNLMLVGRSGLGKSTLVNSIFSTHLRDSKVKPFDNTKTTEVTVTTHLMNENDVNVKLSIVDTPGNFILNFEFILFNDIGFGDLINNENAWEPIVKYIKDQYSLYLRRELTPAREKIISDTRVHAVIYFLSPSSAHGLLPLDIIAMKQISEISNLIPVIAKSDTLTMEEKESFKERVREELAFHNIHIYPDVNNGLVLEEMDPIEKRLNEEILVIFYTLYTYD